MMSQLETCDLCAEIHPLRKIHFDGRQFLCRKCRIEQTNPANWQAVASGGKWRHVVAGIERNLGSRS